VVKLTRWCLLLTLLAGSPSPAYWNVDPTQGTKAGAHRAINRCAWDLWVTTRVREKTSPPVVYKQYGWGDTDLRALAGKTFANRGDWLKDMTVSQTSLNVPGWIAEGGFTADEPEVWACLRHFYDPTQPEGRRYLTDIPWLGRFREYLRSIARTDVETVNPETDARQLALHGNGQTASFGGPFCWYAGPSQLAHSLSDLTYSRQERDRDVSLYWRSLGEVMHLMADMTMPSHVRNDGHPGTLPAGHLRPDPYEEWIQGPQVIEAFRSIPRTGPLARLDPAAAVPPEIASAIANADSPQTLFHAVASWTNRNFVTNDTMSGTDPKGQPVRPLNGVVYPKPVLGKELVWDPELRVYSTSFANRGAILMAKQTWQSNSWGDYIFNPGLVGANYGYETSRDCALSMAHILVPVAAMANAKLLDWYMPRFVATITSIDTAAAGQPIRGSVEHTPYGVLGEKILPSLLPGTPIDLYLDGRPQDPRNYELTLTKGKLEGKLRDLNVKKAKRIWIVVELAGLRITSPDYSPTGSLFVQVNKLEKDTNMNNPRNVLGGEPIPDAEVVCTFTVAGRAERLVVKSDKRGSARFAVPLGVTVTVSAAGEKRTVTCTPEAPAQRVGFGWQGHEPSNEPVDPSTLPQPVR